MYVGDDGDDGRDDDDDDGEILLIEELDITRNVPLDLFAFEDAMVQRKTYELLDFDKLLQRSNKW